MAAAPHSGSKRPYSGDVLFGGRVKRPHLSESLADLRITPFPSSKPEASVALPEPFTAAPFGVSPRENSVFFGAAAPGNASQPSPTSVAEEPLAPLNLDSRLAQPLLSNAGVRQSENCPVGSMAQNLEEVLVDMMAGDGDDAGSAAGRSDAGGVDGDGSNEIDMTDTPAEVSSRALVLYRQPARPRNVTALLPLHVREGASGGATEAMDSWFVRHAQDRVKRRIGDLAVVPYQMKRLMIGSPESNPDAADEARRAAPPVIVAKWIPEDEAMDVERV